MARVFRLGADGNIYVDDGPGAGPERRLAEGASVASVTTEELALLGSGVTALSQAALADRNTVYNVGTQRFVSNGTSFVEVGAGGSSGGGGIETAPGRYVATIVVAPGQSLQAAVDSAPASASLVRTLTSPADLGSNTYAFAIAAKPTKVFIDADELSERPADFDPTTKAYIGGLAGAAFVWAWDATGSRVLVHNKGAAATTVVVADYVAIVATSAAKYDAVDLRPGIFIHGINPTVSSIEATTSRLDNSLESPASPFEYTVRAAGYSGIVGMKIVRNGRIASGVDVGGILLPPDRVCDQFKVIDSQVYVSSEFARYSDTLGYRVGIFFGSNESQGGRAKNVVFKNTPMTCHAPVDLFETYSTKFFGLVYIIDSPIHGPFFIDGAKQTFKIINSPIDNQNVPTGRPLPIQEDSAFAFNISGAGTRVPFPGETYYVEFINSPARADRTVGDPSIDGVPFRAFGWDGLTTMLFENSPISAELSFLKHNGTAYNAQQVGRLYAFSSDMPPVEVTGFLPTFRTARVPCQYTKTVVNSVGATSLGFGHFSMDHSQLKLIRSAIVQIRGKFANTANAKTVTVSHGLVGSLAAVKTSTGPYQNAEFVITAHITFENDVVSVLVTSVSDAALAVTGVFRQDLTSGQSYGFSLSSVGVANNDVSIYSQQINLGA